MFAQNLGAAPQQCKTGGCRMIAFLSRLFPIASVRGKDRRLRLRETLSLGEKRFVAVVEYDRRTFLLAGTPANISLLQCLDGGPEEEYPGAVPETELGRSNLS